VAWYVMMGIGQVVIFARARRKAARYEPRHRADRLGRLSNRVLPDLRFQAGMGRGPAPSSLTPPAPKS
jgi:hypothetical protein